MKRILISILGVAALLCCSCSKDEETAINNEQNLEITDARGHIVFYSTTSRSAKVGMVSRVQQGFQKTDTVAIFEASAKRSLYTVDAAGSTLATGSSLYSSAKLVYLSGDVLASGTTHYAVLPAKGAAWSGSNLSVVQNAAQYATPGSQDSTGCIHYGTTTTNAIAFSNLSAMFRLVVVGENTTCDEIRLAATGISGTATITLSSDAISAGNANSISCKAVGNGKFAKDTTYYYGFLPGTYTTLTVTAYNGGTAIDGSAVTYSSKTWSSGEVYNIYLKDGKLYTKKSSLPVADGGCLPGVFTVAEGKTVMFSMGNLQYTTTGNHAVAVTLTAPGTWRFAEHQWEAIGADNQYISSSYEGWIDLFGWGTSGWNSTAKKYLPYSSSTTKFDYTIGFEGFSLTGDKANADWGVYNAISNGGNVAGMWRTLTIDEWRHIYTGRTNANKKFGLATVNGVKGHVILPDSWTLPMGLSFTAEAIAFETNKYTEAEWLLMETNGAVFLPAAGSRSGINIIKYGEDGYYWSSSNSSTSGQRFYFTENSPAWFNNTQFSIGHSVRLVRDVVKD